MTHEEIEAELAEVARDLAHIARRAEIAAANLADVNAAKDDEGLLVLRNADRHIVSIYANHLRDIKDEAETTKTCLEDLIAIIRKEWEEAAQKTMRLAKRRLASKGKTE